MELWTTLRKTFSAWSAHDAERWGAALAFYSLLSLAPLVILVVSIVGLMVGNDVAQHHIISQAEGLIGKDGGNTIRGMIESASKNTSTGVVASIIGGITILFGASGVFGELHSALNKMWDIEPKAQSGLWSFARRRLFSVGMVLAVGFLLLVSLCVSAALAAVGKFIGGLLPLPETALSVIDFFITVAGTAVVFALIFKYVPDTHIPLKDVWKGAVATSLLFAVGKTLIGLYLGKAAVGSAYGAAGSLVVVIVWVYYSAMIFLFGAELTHILAAGEKPQQGHQSHNITLWPTVETFPRPSYIASPISNVSANGSRFSRVAIPATFLIFLAYCTRLASARPKA